MGMSLRGLKPPRIYGIYIYIGYINKSNSMNKIQEVINI